MTDDAGPLRRLAACVEQRIATLGLEYAEVARLAGFSIEVLRKVRNGIKVRSTTYRKLEKALLWSSGSAQAVLDGGEPSPIDSPTPAEVVGTHTDHRPDETSHAAQPALSSRELELLADIVTSAAEGFDLSSEEMEEAFRMARARLEKKRAALTRPKEPPEAPSQHRAG